MKDTYYRVPTSDTHAGRARAPTLTFIRASFAQSPLRARFSGAFTVPPISFSTTASTTPPPHTAHVNVLDLHPCIPQVARGGRSTARGESRREYGGATRRTVALRAVFWDMSSMNFLRIQHRVNLFYCARVLRRGMNDARAERRMKGYGRARGGADPKSGTGTRHVMACERMCHRLPNAALVGVG